MFETKSVEDRAASIEAGHYVGKDVDYAYITPAGSKDRIERVVSEWLPQVRVDVEQGRLPQEWADHYNRIYRSFKEGTAAPVNGIPVKDWPGLSPSMFKTLQSLHLLAIEDVAAANEETIARLGMGGRALVQRARDYIAASKDVGQVAERASATAAELEASKAREASLREQVAAMQGQLAALAAGTGIQLDPLPGGGISLDDLGLGEPL